MKKVLDFQKAIEQMQKRQETKEKHNPGMSEIEVAVKCTKEISNTIDGILGDLETTDKFLKNVTDLNSELVTICKSLQADNKRYLYFSLLAEHFIVKNDLEEEFIEFIKNVAENETEEDYREAAQWKDRDYRTEMKNGDIVEMILDEYGMDKEDKYQLYDEDMEEAN